MGEPGFWPFSCDQQVVKKDQEAVTKRAFQRETLDLLLKLKYLLDIDIDIVSQKEMVLSRVHFFIWE